MHTEKQMTLAAAESIERWRGEEKGLSQLYRKIDQMQKEIKHKCKANNVFQ